MYRNHDRIEKTEYGTIKYSPSEQSAELHHLGGLKDAIAKEQKDGSFQISDLHTGKLLVLSDHPIMTKVEAGFLAYERGYMIEMFYDKNGRAMNHSSGF